jgi:acetylornithine/N-succinyldiaminopimelate aminotransferase
VSVLPTYARYDVTFERGEGVNLWDADGNQYLDLLSGIGVCSVGHCHPRVSEAVARQASQLIHVSNLFWTAGMVSLAERLSARSLGGGVFFCNSGAEANEAAIKLARKAKPRGDIVVIHGAFHGRTYGALSATPQEAKQAPFAPIVPGFVPVPADAEAIHAAVGEQTAAVLLEPVQGESGIHPLALDVLRAAREACDRVGAALIFDEVQSGMGRTGTLFAYEPTGVKPDLMTLAKALAGGLPIGALVTSPAYAEVLAPGDHGSTFGGNPLVCAAAHAALDVLDDPDLLRSVQEVGARLAEGLRDMPSVTSVRGRGLMIGADVALDAREAVQRALSEERLVINATGPHTIRLLPPLVITPDQADEALERLARIL